MPHDIQHLVRQQVAALCVSIVGDDEARRRGAGRMQRLQQLERLAAWGRTHVKHLQAGMWDLTLVQTNAEAARCLSRTCGTDGTEAGC
jgi:hypothetical protein